VTQMLHRSMRMAKRFLSNLESPVKSGSSSVQSLNVDIQKEITWLDFVMLMLTLHL